MIKSLTDDQANKLLHAVRYTHRSPATQHSATRNYLLLSLMTDAGLRVGELVLLHNDDVYFAGQPQHTLNLRSQTTKTQTTRLIPLTDRIQWAINNYIDSKLDYTPNRHSTWLFPSKYNPGHITTRQVQRIVQRKGIDLLNIELHPHILRHTFATRLMRTTSIAIVQELLGHRRLSSTQVYLHPNNQDLKSAIDKLNKTQPNPQ